MKKEITILIFLIISVASVVVKGQDCKPERNNNLLKTNVYVDRVKFNVNNISAWIYNNGENDVTPNGSSGFEFPKLSGKTAVFQSGVLWGGKVNGEIRVGGSTYNPGLKGGRILDDGGAEDANLNSVRIYKVRRDYKTADLSSEAEDEDITVEQVYLNYEIDWNEWPANYGAPYEDVDNDGVYSPLIDIPGVAGADKTLWFVSNDLNADIVDRSTGSPPIGLEIQVTV